VTDSDQRKVEAAPGRTSTFASLSNPTYSLLFWSGALSFLAVQGQFVARGWLANDLTGSATGLGGVYMAFGVPMLLATPYAGAVADRMPKRTILVWTQALLAASSLWLGLGVSFDFVEYWMLLASSAMQAIAFSFLAPARMAMTSEIVGRGLLSNAIVLGQMSMNTTRVFGPALAGVAIGVAWFGTAGVYYAATAISLAAGFAMSRLPRTTPHTGPRRSPMADFRLGLQYVGANREVKWLLVTSFLVVMVAFPYVAFLPQVADDLYDVGASGYGVLSAFSAVGAVGISLFAARRSGNREAFRIQNIAGFGFGIGLLLLAVAPGYVAGLGAVFVIGAAASAFQSMNNALALGISEFEYHGRIQSLMMLSFSGFGMAALPLGVLADAIGLRETFALMGGVTVLTMVGYLAVRARHGASPAAFDHPIG
jgi:predicted MFS family arabinose efflux permease